MEPKATCVLRGFKVGSLVSHPYIYFNDKLSRILPCQIQTQKKYKTHKVVALAVTPTHLKNSSQRFSLCCLEVDVHLFIWLSCQQVKKFMSGSELLGSLSHFRNIKCSPQNQSHV